MQCSSKLNDLTSLNKWQITLILLQFLKNLENLQKPEKSLKISKNIEKLNDLHRFLEIPKKILRIEGHFAQSKTCIRFVPNERLFADL